MSVLARSRGGGTHAKGRGGGRGDGGRGGRGGGRATRKKRGNNKKVGFEDKSTVAPKDSKDTGGGDTGDKPANAKKAKK